MALGCRIPDRRAFDGCFGSESFSAQAGFLFLPAWSLYALLGLQGIDRVSCLHVCALHDPGYEFETTHLGTRGEIAALLG
jgi:hypothetical protein